MSHLRSTEADALRCGYDIGYFDKSDIANWADRQIEATEAPSIALLDLSVILHTHPLDVIKLLARLGAVDPATTIETRIGFIGLLGSEKHITTQLAIWGLWSLIYEPGLTDEQQSQIYFLDDGYDLAVAGTCGTMDDIERELDEFVTPYSERLVAQHPSLLPALVCRNRRKR